MILAAGWLDGILGRLGELGAVALHALAAGLAFGETAMFLDLLVPGEVGLVLVGAAGARAGSTLVTLVAAGAAGAIAGDSCSYALGRWASHRSLERWPSLAARLERSRERAQGFVERHGGRAVFLGRWVGALRAVVPFVAGAGGMAYGRFLVWNVLASVAWVTAVVTLGWTLGDEVAAVVDRYSTYLSVAVVAGLAVWFLRRRRARRAGDRPSPDGA